MKFVKKAFRYLADSRGFSLPRVCLTSVYVFLIVYCAPRFAFTVGQYKEQMLSFCGTVIGALLLWRSLKKMFDEKTRDKISAVVHKVWGKISEKLSIFGKKVLKALGLDNVRAKGQDEKDFVFRERHGRRRTGAKLRNPMHWSELEDNAQRVRFIFIEFMLRAFRSGYRLKPSATPDDIGRDLAAEEEEKLLFETYRLARYSGGREPIDDRTVEILEELKDKKKKK